MKKLGFTAFIAFWASVGTLMMLFWLVPVTPSDASAEKPGFTLQEVARHNTAEDCWMAIEGRVYDFSDYMPKHPAPVVVMANWCGKEATEGMKTKGYGNDHSQAAWDMMVSYQIGLLTED